MNITKIGHCCLIIKTKSLTLLTDPGSFTAEANTKLENIDYILFTHEHQDHYHLESLKVIMEKNPQAKIYANKSVSELLDNEHIPHITITHNETVQLGEIPVLGFGEKHAQMHSSIPLSANLGFFIDNRLWYPGDAFTNPERSVDILALPCSGPWMKISEAIDYALLLKPKVAFPVHDAICFGSAHMLPEKILSENNIQFIPMKEGDSQDF